MDTNILYNWPSVWHWTIMTIVLLSVLYILFSPKSKLQVSPAFHSSLVYILFIFIAVFFALEPIILYSDKWNYKFEFLQMVEGTSTVVPNDIGFYYYTLVVSKLTHSPFLYFFITALFYCLGYIVFINKRIPTQYRFLLVLMAVSSLGFFAYGVNTIRAGLALSIFLVVLSRRSIWNANILLLILVILIHKSFLLPVVAFLITRIYNRRDNFLPLWIIFFVLSLVGGNYFLNLFGGFFNFVDQRVIDYSTTNIQNYRTGFRWDFILYSVIPILLAFYYKRKGYYNEFYNQLLSVYIISNAIWLLLIRMPFTDRVAALSWFLIPFVTLYPLLRKRMFYNQNYWIAGVIFVNALITLILSIR